MKMDKLRVRMYNVRFGEAILVSVPDRNQIGDTVIRHILIDFGNVKGGEGGEDVVFQPVFEDILKELNGQPLDLYVMTHEHMDHVQGPLFMNRDVLTEHDLKEKLNIQHAWLTVSSSGPDYYKKHDKARRHLDEVRNSLKDLEKFLKATTENVEGLRALMTINSPHKTDDCVNFIRKLAKHTWYVHCDLDLADKHSFEEAHFEIWAPEEDSSIYYGRFHPLQFGITPGQTQDENPTLTIPLPPAGVDAGTFYNLVNMRHRGCMEALLAIDKAANNTSIVFCLEWRGWRLLFTGDAEKRSWLQMEKRGFLKPVHFLKVSHHGSTTGTPKTEILNKILPVLAPGDRPRFSAVSTFPDTYSGVPDDDSLFKFGQFCQLKDTRSVPDGDFIDILFPG